MAAQGYEDDFDAYDDDDSDESDDWALLSSTPSSPSPPVTMPPLLPPQPTLQPARTTTTVRSSTTVIPSSPQCSMDDDSSTDGEELLPSFSQRAATSSRLPGKSEHYSVPDSERSQGTSAQQRKVRARELVSKYHKECINQYYTLVNLQRQWRQELDDPVPGLSNYDYLQPEEVLKQREIIHSNSDRRIQSSTSAVPKSRTNSTASAKYHSGILPGGNSQGSGRKMKHGLY